MYKSAMNKVLDKFGICVSGLCLIHCILTSIVIILFPTLNATFFDHESFHEVFATMVVISVLLAVYPHCRRHGHKDIVIFDRIGTALIVMAIYIGHQMGIVFEHGMTILGSIFLIWAHIKNIKVRHGRCESDCNSTKEAN